MHMPLGRLLAVEPIYEREFADWQSLSLCVRSYAQCTDQVHESTANRLANMLSANSIPLVQLYFVRSLVPVAAHNAAILRSDALAQVPKHFGIYSQVFGCTHGNGDSQCPAKIEAQVMCDWSGQWRVAIWLQIAWHNHDISNERYAAAREMAKSSAHVPEVEKLTFSDWPEFHAFVAAYGTKTFQHYYKAESELVATRNAETAAQSIPKRFGTFSVLLRCIHYDANVHSNWHPPDTKCPAKIVACLKEDVAGRRSWRVAITQQVEFHNHDVDASLYTRFDSSTQEPATEADSADAGPILLTHGQTAMEESAHKQQDPYHPRAAIIHAPSDEEDSSSVNAADIGDHDGDSSDLDPCVSNDEATEVVQLDHLIRVHPMRQTVFQDWSDMINKLDAYNRASHQLLVPRSRTLVGVRNAVIEKKKKTNREFIPDRFGHYWRLWQCAARHSGLNCPAQISACVKKEKSSGEWKVMISQQKVLHNHHVNEKLVRSYAKFPHITDPVLQAGIMKLHFKGANCEEIMEYIHQQSGIQPNSLDVYNLIRKIKREGWIVDTCGQDMAPESGADNRQSSSFDHESEGCGNEQRKKLRSADANAKRRRPGTR